MPVVHRNALVPYSARQMFDLVNDIDAYPQYMDGCLNTRILTKGDNVVIASLELAKGGIRYSFTTKNTLKEPSRIDMALVDGPFKQFCGQWKFISLQEEACKVSLDLSFEFSGQLTTMVFQQLFNRTANSLVDALCKRAESVYGLVY